MGKICVYCGKAVKRIEVEPETAELIYRGFCSIECYLGFIAKVSHVKSLQPFLKSSEMP